jgi:hypothetical protein
MEVIKMGMGYAPNYAYAIEMTPEMMEKFNITMDELNNYYDNNEPVLDKISKAIGIPPLGFDVFLYNRDDGDRYDDMIDGHYYILFEEEILYEPRETTEEYEKIIEVTGEYPRLTQWVSFG